MNTLIKRLTLGLTLTTFSFAAEPAQTYYDCAGFPYSFPQSTEDHARTNDALAHTGLPHQRMQTLRITNQLMGATCTNFEDYIIAIKKIATKLTTQPITRDPIQERAISQILSLPELTHKEELNKILLNMPSIKLMGTIAYIQFGHSIGIVDINAFIHGLIRQPSKDQLGFTLSQSRTLNLSAGAEDVPMAVAGTDEHPRYRKYSMETFENDCTIEDRFIASEFQKLSHLHNAGYLQTFLRDTYSYVRPSILNIQDRRLFLSHVVDLALTDNITQVDYYKHIIPQLLPLFPSRLKDLMQSFKEVSDLVIPAFDDGDAVSLLRYTSGTIANALYIHYETGSDIVAAISKLGKTSLDNQRKFADYYVYTYKTIDTGF